MIATHRSHSSPASGANDAYGVDAAFSFFKDVNMNAYWAQTRTDLREGDDASYMGRVDYDGDRYGARAEYLAVGSNFNPEVGFLRRSDFRRRFASGRFSPRPRRSKRIRKFTWEGSTEHVVDGRGNPENSLVAGHFDLEFHNSDRLTVEGNRKTETLDMPFVITRGVTLPQGGYEFSDVLLSYTLGLQRRASGTFGLQHGAFYDGKILAATYTRGRVSLTKHLSMDPSLSVHRVRLTAGNFTTALYRTRIDYAFSPWAITTALLQYSSADRTFSSNLRFRWEYSPGSELFAVYTDEHDTTYPGIGSLKNRAFAVKINRLVKF